MPRGKDAPAITGGQIDPYVATTMQQKKQQTENRLLTAMQEKGATQRAGIAASAQLGAQKMRGEQQLEAQAAQSAADDRRAAEAERGRREDMKFAETMQKATQSFQARQTELRREHELALRAEDYARQDKTEKKQDALRKFRIIQQTADKVRSTNAIMSILKGSEQKESMMEKARTTVDQKNKEFREAKDIYEREITRVRDKMSSDKRMDLPVGGEIIMRGTRVTPSMGFGAGYAQIPTVKPGTTADPMGVLQDQLVGVSIEDFAPENIHRYMKELQTGKVPAEDIRTNLGAIYEMIDLIAEKKKENPLSKNKVAYDFWNETRIVVTNARDALEGVADNTDKVEGNENLTVGMPVRTALEVINQNSLGGQAEIYREAFGSLDGVVDSLAKALNPVQLYPTDDPTLNEYDIAERNTWNAGLIEAYPELNLGGTE